ncbi:MAG: trigger factor [bacterium]
MKILEVQTQGSTRKKVSVMVPKDIMDDTLSRKLLEFKKSVRVPGFRKGKVPESVLKSRFEQDIRYEAELDVIDDTIKKAIEELKIKAVGNPIIEKKDYTGEGDFTYTVIIENIPEIEHVDFKGIELKKLPVPEVTEEQVQEALIKIQKKMGVLMPLAEERPLRDKDIASIKLIELDKLGKPKKVNDDLIWTVDDKLGKEFYDQMIGMLVGEKRKIIINKEKNIQAIVELKSIKYIKYPPIDDELAKATGKYNTLDELKSAIKQDIKNYIEKINKYMYQDMIVAALIERHPIELPLSLVKAEMEQLATFDKELQRAYMMSNKQGIEDRLRDIETYVRIGLVARVFFDAIKKQEGLTLSDEELRQEIEKTAQENNETYEQVMERLNRNNELETFKNRLLNEKVLDLILKNAKFIEERIENNANTNGHRADTEG